MSDFRTLEGNVYASPQISIDDIADAKARGITLVINNRPDGEDAGQPTGAEIEAAARAAGLHYVEIPVTQAGFSEPQIRAMAEALAGSAEGTLAYCRSGTRSTNLWALARAYRGAEPEHLLAVAAKAGYDLTGIRPMLDMLSAQSR
ncbi:MAG: TIGR01244 family sulfur transferase [Novosphingobium sp.]